MCGIAGAFGYDAPDIGTSLDRLRHRGPDGRAEHATDLARLGHVRLAIVDVDGGRQPMSDAGQTRWLICNGEIYNHQHLRAAHRDYHFRTRSDTEVILPLYRAHGPDAVKHLDGMFAFALVDGDNLLLARDPLGIKPLYYGYNGDALCFASEIKALQGMVEEVREFPPGHYFTPGTGFARYYDVASVADRAARDEPAGPADVRDCLELAVAKRLMSDVPLGVFLSGGLDSSIIAALVRQAIPGVHSFAVGVEGSEDLARAREVAAYLGTQHHEYVYTPDEMRAVLPDVIFHLESFDPALVRSAVAYYFLARLASEHVTVVLSGEGADELYSGYSYLKRFPTQAALGRELVEITAELHDRNLQRLDRMTMAHGLEGRVPFLDADFLALSFSVPVDQKLYGAAQTEKWVLRKAFEGALPDHIVWRRKEKFSKGAGSADVFARIAEDEIADEVCADEARRVEADTGQRIASKEALYYYRVFRRFFDEQVTGLVGRSRSL